MAGLAAGALTGAVLTAISALEGMNGVPPIAVIERHNDNPQQVYNDLARTACAETGNPRYCSSSFRKIDPHAPLAGKSDMLELKNANRLCAVFPPATNLPPSVVSRKLSSGTVRYDMPASNESEAFFTLYHAGRCAFTGTSQAQIAKAFTFAATVLTLAEGDTSFVSKRDQTPGREYANLLGQKYGSNMRSAVATGSGVAERLLMDHWKQQAAAELANRGCDPNVVASDNIDMPGRNLATQLPADACAVDTGNGNNQLPTQTFNGGAPITDQNLHLWMSSTYRQNDFGRRDQGVRVPEVGEPPAPYQAFDARFGGNADRAIRYARQVAQQAVGR